MTDLAPHLTAFFRNHLREECGASRHTISSYAGTFRLLLVYAAEKYGTQPSALKIEQLDVETILDFLRELETSRQNCVRTRNVRLAAIKRFFRYLELRSPECLERAQQVREIPVKKFVRTLVDYLDMEELEALLDAPDTRTRTGVRDRAMIYVAYAGGLRVSELLGLGIEDFGSDFRELSVRGKGRKNRTLPLRTEARAALLEYISIRVDSRLVPAFLNARGYPMTRSGFAGRLRIYTRTASEMMPSLTEKNVTPHTLRHTCAMHILAATGDIRKVSLWLGHECLESTQQYLHDDPIEKLDTLGAMVAPELKRGNFNLEDDGLLEMLRNSGVVSL